MEYNNKKNSKQKDKKEALFIKWRKTIDTAESFEEKWRKEAKEYFDIYSSHNHKDVFDVSNHIFCKNRLSQYNILWANTETLKPLLYSQPPKPSISRRFNDSERIPRILSEIMERALRYFIEKEKMHDVFIKVRDDFLIGGRGVQKIAFNPGSIIELNKDVEKPVDKSPDETSENQKEEEIEEEIDFDDKRLYIQYIPWENFRMSGEKRWEDVKWVAFKHLKTRHELIEQFGKVAEKVQMTFLSTDINSECTPDDSLEKGERNIAEIWEIWDKETERVIWLANDDYGLILQDEEPPFQVEGFFPMPKPLGSESNPNGLVPIPLYRMYKEQAEELNLLLKRRASLVKQLTFSGVYSAISESPDIKNLMNGNDGEFYPLTGIGMNNDIRSSIMFKPIEIIPPILAQLENTIQTIIRNIRDITGISDIVRGTTYASETATAQRLKGNFAISRIRPLQSQIELNTRDSLRLFVEVLVENYSINELAKITNLQIIDKNLILEQDAERRRELVEELEVLLTQQVQNNEISQQEAIQQLESEKQKAQQTHNTIAEKINDDLKGYTCTPEELLEVSKLMQDDKMRSFNISVETESTISIDQDQQKEERISYTNMMNTTIANFLPLVQDDMISQDTFNQLLSYISSPFKVGRNIEEAFLTLDTKSQEQQGPSIEQQLAQEENKRKDTELQLKAQETQFKGQEVAIKQQLANIEKAKILQGQLQFEDQLEFDDVNKEADRDTRMNQELIKTRTEELKALISNSNLSSLAENVQ